MIRIVLHVVIATAHNIIQILIYVTVLLIFTAILTGVTRPYKLYYYNFLDIMHILIISIIPLISTSIITSTSRNFETQMIIIVVCGVLPLVYVAATSLHWIFFRKKVPQKILHRVWILLSCKKVVRQSNSEELLPDRLVNSEECALLSEPMVVEQYTDVARGGLDSY